MLGAKTITLTFRLDPPLKEALHNATQREQRSITNMVEALISDHCRENHLNVEPMDATDSEKGGPK